MRRFLGSMKEDPKPPEDTDTSGRTFHESRIFQNDSNAQKTVAKAAQDFGEGVQTIVVSAKIKQNYEWKSQLLELLGQESSKTALDTLLSYTKLKDFVDICCEHDLPPNLVHCLRLLRVLELQNDTSESVSQTATRKVTQLLVKLCVSDTVGDLLRPHLFGLFALSGASYPDTGIHVCQAASDIIVAFAKHCLNNNLIWFIHDRKMIIHMTDDIKELHTNQSHDILVIAITTVVWLLYYSHTAYNNLDLVGDFEGAGGYKVFADCLNGPKRSKLFELIPKLAVLYPDSPNHIRFNRKILELFANLMVNSNPLIENPDMLNQPGDLRALAKTALTKQDINEGLCEDILSMTLQLFADQPENYEILEQKMHVLTYSVLSIPMYKNPDVKKLVLKTFEMVLTGPDFDTHTPIEAMTEVFFVAELADMELICALIEKLLEFDERVAPLMIQTNLWKYHVTELIKTSDDRRYCLVCRVLHLLVAHQPVYFRDDENLRHLVEKAVTELSIDAAAAASTVFEAFMSRFPSETCLNDDMSFVLKLLETNELSRVSVMLSMLRSVLEEKNLSRRSFRVCGGFDALLGVVLRMNGDEKEAMDVLLNLMGLLDAAIGMKNRNAVTANEISPLQITADVSVDYVSSQLSSSQSSSSSNRNYLRQRSFYLNLAAAIAGTGLLKTAPETVLEMILGHMDPELTQTPQKDIQTMRNPDACRLAMGLAVFLPDARNGNPMSKQIMDRVLRLSEQDRVASTLPRLASCGLCYSLTNPKEFGPILYDSDHSLQSRFALLLSRLAACSMSYMDFVSILRNVAGPMLCNEEGYVRLPVISSSVKKKGITVSLSSRTPGPKEDQFAQRLETICEIAKNADRNARVIVGGDSINTIGVLMHEVPLDERLKATAEEGRLRYLEVESLDASAILPSEEPSTHDSAAAAAAKLWTPLTGSGFSYSMWLRHEIPIGSGTGGNLHVLDLCCLSNTGASSTSQSSSFLSVWYDLQNQRFNVMSSASYRGEPTCFPVSPLQPNAWHHVLITYTPAKRSMIARKSVFAIYVNGRPLEVEVRVESVNLPPNSRLVIGAPNPALAMSGVVRGVLPVWELGPTLLLSTVLLDLDATAIYAYGPSFPGLLWGDRPERLSLAATGTVLFSMLSTTGEAGSIASALRRRDIARLELSGYSATGHLKKDNLSAMNLFCNIPPDCVVFGFQASTVSNRMRNEAVKKESRLGTERLVNLARLNFGSDVVSTDAIVYGRGSVAAPLSFADCLRWVGGPHVLFPLVNAACSSKTVALALQMIRVGCQEHRPNLEMLQARGGYRMLSVILQGKGLVDETCMDQCLAFAIHGFEPDPNALLSAGNPFLTDDSRPSIRSEDSLKWIFSDLDAMKQLLLNHQVWDLRRFGPRVPLRMLSILNILVDHSAVHKAFNARRLHQIGIVRWALHSAIEAAELYAQNEEKGLDGSLRGNEARWVCESPRVAEVSVGGDPGNPFLLECKNLLRRVLTFMLTPGDLEALVQTIVFTESIGSAYSSTKGEDGLQVQDELMRPGPTLRLHLLRLLEELIVDGVNEIVATVKAQNGSARDDFVVPHAGGVASPNQPYFATSSTRGKDGAGGFHPRHQQAQNFLTAFSSFLTPAWFATVLEGCEDEASACAILRLMILMLQGSATLEEAFRESGAFAPFVMSIPRFSTCPGVAIAILSQLLNVPILHLHSLPTLDKEQLCEVFDAEALDADYELVNESADPSSGIFALLVECIGRNIQLVATKGENWEKAASTNQAIVHLLAHRHSMSPRFREYCLTLSFLEPLAQALCLVYNEQLQPHLRRSKRPSLLVDVPKDLTPTERFIGSLDDPDSTGLGIVKLIRLVITDAVTCCPKAAQIIYCIFRSFPLHASPQQVAAFHLVLIEHCCSVIDGVLQRGEGDALALANCVGVCSVLVDHEVGAFFTSEAALKTVTTTFSILDALLRFDTPAVYSITNTEHSLLTRDAAYMANLAAVTALRISLPVNDSDRCDEELQSRILELFDKNISLLLLLPARDRKSNWKVPTGKIQKPVLNSKLYGIWESSSVSRCIMERPVFFPDFYAVGNPDKVVIAPLLVSLHRLLTGSSEDIRSLAISILVSLLQNRSTLLSELLVAEVKRNGKIELIDVVNRGGFKALMMAHEVANVADRGQSSDSVKKRYSSFFEWFERSQEDVQLVFNSIEKKAREVFPGLQETAATQEQTVENEQKLMLMRLSTRSADRSLVGGLEREELARLCSETTTEVHSEWRRGGFDDLAYGAMKWKFLLRQLKGSTSVWEGGSRFEEASSISLDDRLARLRARDSPADCDDSLEHVKRWKLDMTEGYEHQRRRLLPNYEFHGLYNLEEEQDAVAQSSTPSEKGEKSGSSPDFLGGGQLEATAAILKDLNIKRAHRLEEDLDETEADSESAFTDSTALTGETQSDTISVGTNDEDKEDALPEVKSNEVDASEGLEEEKDSSGYELITGLLQAGDWPQKCYNVRRCTGLEVTKAIFLWCEKAIYVIDGFEIITGNGDWKISRVERERSSFHINLRPKDFMVREESGSDTGKDSKSKGVSSSSKRDFSRQGQQESTNEVIYEHRSHRILLTELYSVYRRRYQLQQTGLEVYDTNRNSVLIAFETHGDREEILSKVIQSDIPNSIFGSGYGTSFLNYTKFMTSRKAKITSQWQSGKITNFEFLMELNSLAGRSFHDLTQYPVFPWIIADYESEEIDLSDPKTYRDLSKPMGAIGEDRARQFRERYEALASTYFGDDDPPPFHYGTHYSCAAYVLYYLMRLEPFSRLALALQGGRFDVADRLFHDVGRSWKSASSENLQDVRELIPEFYYLPDFLVNTNHFDFGETQRGKLVHDVTLPKWAKDDPKLFIRINRQALESEYVSNNLHKWVDLVFGCKQRGEEAVEALNTFVHVTYEGEVDIDAMTDPVQRQSTIAQIQNFGQTPSRLERWPFPHRNTLPVLKDKSIDFSALATLTVSTPPLCVLGAPHRVHLQHVLTDTCKLGLAGQYDPAVGDLCYFKGQLIAAGKMNALMIPSKKYVRFGGLNNGVTVHVGAITARYREINRLISVHDDLHRAPVSAARASLNGNWLVTGCVDSTLRVWYYDGAALDLRSSLCGHDGSHITCIDVSTECGVIASGCGRGKVLLWDLRTLTFVRPLKLAVSDDSPVVSVSINHKNGNVLALAGQLLCIYGINGNLIAKHEFNDSPTCAVATDCPEWMDNGIVAVSGHETGAVQLWSINYETEELVKRYTLEGGLHSCPITALRVTGTERQDTLLVGDSSGKVTVSKTAQLDSYCRDELELVVKELSQKSTA